MDETYAVNKLRELLDRRVSKIGLQCCAVREFGETENAAAGMEILTGLGGWTFIFCAANDKAMRDQRCESYIFFDDGIELGGDFERMVDLVYRRLCDELDRRAAKRGVVEIPDIQ